MRIKVSSKLVLRLLLTAGMLAFAYRHVDLDRLGQTLRAFSFPNAVVLFLIYIIGQTFSAFKWSCILKAASIHRTYVQIIAAYFFGMFVNAFGLGTVGGDVVRALAIRPQAGERGVCFSTVIADRIHGLTVLLSIGIAGIFLVNPQTLSRMEILGIILIFACLVVGWFFGPALLVRIFSGHSKLKELALKLARGFPRAKWDITLITLVSLAFHLSQITLTWYIALNLGADIPFIYMLAVVPIVNFASTLPISFNGIGVRETLLLLFLTPMGVSNEIAVGIAAVWIICVTLVSALAGIIAPTIVPDLSISWSHASKGPVAEDFNTLALAENGFNEKSFHEKQEEAPTGKVASR